ncbi:hypothetical protein ACFFII_04155 [Paracoccus niistensis]|uniref:Uncharacterized protein n=2 Tax=Paracoccus niistensis TaxID=632935 RepID=A0ABV6I358_9RHOB
MNIHNGKHKKTFKKYDLIDEALAAATAGMHPVTAIDTRCITFTIHLTSAARHEPLCRTLFGTTETFFTELGVKRRSASHTGLLSFIDVNGSKFTGAARDESQVHCHGAIFIPHGTSKEDCDSLIKLLASEARDATDKGALIAKPRRDAVQFTMFDRNRPDASLKNWIAYAQKEEVRVRTVGTFGVFLPFDKRNEDGQAVASKIEGKRDKTLAILQGYEGFKVFRYPRKVKL